MGGGAVAEGVDMVDGPFGGGGRWKEEVVDRRECRYGNRRREINPAEILPKGTRQIFNYATLIYNPSSMRPRELETCSVRGFGVSKSGKFDE